MINQPKQTPKFPGQPNGRAFRRGPFLDGTESAMFMPGQFSIGKANDACGDWPAAGKLLRVPKCVYLSSVPVARLWGDNWQLMSMWTPFGYLGHYNDPVQRDTRYTEPYTAQPFGSLIFDGFTGTYTYIGWAIDPQYPEAWNTTRGWRKYTKVPNLMVTEHARLMGEFASAKATLEAKYPGEVFVEIAQFFPSNPVTAINTTDQIMPKVLDISNPANSPTHATKGPTWILGPDSVNIDSNGDVSGMDFFGTNFLHMYCGYQSSDQWLLPGDGGFQDVSTPSTADLTTRVHWENNATFGYPLGANLAGMYYPWLAKANDGYEGDSYNWTHDYMTKGMNLVNSDPTTGKVSAVFGKLAKLRAGINNFAGYHVALFNYDMSFDFGAPATFTPQHHETMWPRYDLVYDDQDWVEQAIVLGYLERSEADTDLADDYYPDFNYMDYVTSGGYNFFVRYMPTSWYDVTWSPQLLQQWTYMKNAITDLGTKTATLWNQLISENNLSDLGFEYAGGSSQVNAAYIVSYVENYYKLT